MKKLYSFITTVLLLTACGPGKLFGPTISPTPTSTLTPTITPTSTLTSTLSPSPTKTPTPTLALPVGIETPAPDSGSPITSGNVKDLQEIVRYYGNAYIVRLTKNQTRLFIRDTVGVYLYDYETSKLLLHIDLVPHSSNMSLQISDNGDWAAIDGYWLFHPSTDSTEKDLRVIGAHSGLDPNLDRGQIALSPDGKKAAIYRYGYNGGIVIEKFYILDLETDQFTYTWTGGYTTFHGFNPIFSPDGSLIATQVDNQIIVWNVTDGMMVRKFLGDGFSIDFTISDDLSWLAIREKDSVNIWNLKTGEKVQSIGTGTYCYSHASEFGNNTPIFVGLGKKIAIFDCQGNIRVWSVAEGDLLNEYHYDIAVPSVLFDEEGKAYEISPSFNRNPWKTWMTLYGPNGFRFLGNQSIAIQGTYNISCVLLLQSGNQNCVENTILGTDGNFYRYNPSNNILRLYDSSTNSSIQPIYEMNYQGIYLEIDGIDPQHTLLLYTLAYSNYNYQGTIRDFENHRILGSWEKSGISSFVYSEDNKNAAIYIWDMNLNGKLVLFNLEEGRIVFAESFSKLSSPTIALSHSDENRRLALGRVNPYSHDPPYFTLLDFNQPYTRQRIEISCPPTALAFSPDDSFVVAGCGDGSLHFINSSDGKEFFYMNGYVEVEGFAFSPDGMKMAIYFGKGVISVLAIPPFRPADSDDIQVLPPGMNPNISFDYPKDGQRLEIGGDYMFKLIGSKDASGYSWSISQNGKMIIENYSTPDVYFTIASTAPVHSKFVPGEVQVIIRAWINGKWTDPTMIVITLK